MTDKRLREFDLIRWIRGMAPADGLVHVGIGDDAAVVANRADATLITTDMLVDGVHFDSSVASLADVGWKALACSVSDVAAMGGRSTAAVVSSALPAGFLPEQAQQLVEGMLACAGEFGARLVGGDVTSSGGGPLTLCVTLLGDTEGRAPVLRSGARVGDAILVTGTLGGSRLGRHLRFRPRQAEGILLSRDYHPHAMIDVSDGLAIDLYHILDESGVGAEVEAASIPVSEDAAELARETGRTALEHALGDGEDYELLFTLDPATADRLLADAPLDVRATRIGLIVESGATLILADGTRRRLDPVGWEHVA